jgi:two-component system, sensor histidine kinase RegB
MIAMPHRSAQRIGPFALARTLAWLRLCAIAGQSVAVLVCAWWMQLGIPVLPLLVGIGLLAVFSVFAAWRLTQPWPVREWETISHIAVDTLVLGYLLYFTGGASNPFITLLLVPIALSAAALSVRAILAVSALAGVA